MLPSILLRGDVEEGAGGGRNWACGAGLELKECWKKAGKSSRGDGLAILADGGPLQGGISSLRHHQRASLPDCEGSLIWVKDIALILS